MVPTRISYAQNGEDVRIWHAFGPIDADPTCSLRYVDVGANQPYDLSLTASLYELGWSGVLVEADPDLADELRVARPRDTIVEAIASNSERAMDFFRVPGTGLCPSHASDDGSGYPVGLCASNGHLPPTFFLRGEGFCCRRNQ